MGLGAEAFTILAILEARNQASEAFAQVNESLAKLGEAAGETADTVKAATEVIDESLLSTASGADALDLAAAKVQAARDQVTAATAAQAEAEEALLAASASGAASQEELGAAAENVAVAQQRAAAAETEQTAALAAQRDALVTLIAGNEEAAAATGLMVDATGRLRDSSGQFASAAQVQQAAQDAVNASNEAGSGTADTLAAANDRVAESQRAVAAAADESTAAQAKQDALGGGDSAAVAAQNLATKTKVATAANKDLAAAEANQSAVQAAATQAANGGAEAAERQAAAEKEAAAASKDAEAGLATMGKVAGITALGMGVLGVVAVKAAGNFQSATQHLVTDAGLAPGALAMVRAGILSISSATGTSASDVTNAMYHISSAGITAAAGLKVATIAAEGAKVGNADLNTVSQALVGTMDTYYGAAYTSAHATQLSTSTMNELIAIVGSGDTTMQALTSSLSTVAPVAANAHISLAQVGGAIATMTSQNMTARQATNDLSHTISSLMAPTSVMTSEMAQMGLSSQKVSTQLGNNKGGIGLTGTINELTKAITSHMGPAGTVLMNAFNQSTTAGNDANIMLSKLPASIQATAKGYEDGTVSYNTWYTAVKGLPLQARTMADQFATTAGKAEGFNNILTAGGPAAQTYNAALEKMTGGTVGLKTVLMLSGKNAAMFAANAATAQKAADTGGTSVKNWSAIQGTFNQKLDVAKTSVENTGIAIGSALLPTVSAIAGAVTKVLVPIATWTAKHKTLTAILFIGVTAIAATIAVIALAAKAFKAVSGAVNTVKSVFHGAQLAMQKLGLISKQTADTQKKAATEAADTQEAKAEESATVQEAQAEEAATQVEASAGEAAAAQEEAAAESSAGWVTAAVKTVAQWAKAGVSMIASAAKWVVEGGLKVAAYVAENVFGATATESAWTLANAVMLGGILLVVAAVAIAVIEIVKHWKSIVAGVREAWDAVYDFCSKIITDIVDFIKSHWVLIVSIFLGPIALVAALVIEHFTQVKAYISKIVSDVISFVEEHWRLIITIIGGPLGLAVALVTKYWGDIKHWFQDGVHDVESILSWFGTLASKFGHWMDAAASAVASEGAKFLRWYIDLPMKVLGYLAPLGRDMLTVGENIVKGLWSGITSMAGWLASKVSGFASDTLHGLESAFGIGSPSKYTAVHGQMLGAGLAGGITASTAQAVAAARKMATSVLAATSTLSARSGSAEIGSALAASAVGSAAGSGSAGSGTTIVIDVHGNMAVSDSEINKLAQKVGQVVATKILPQAGRKQRLT